MFTSRVPKAESLTENTNISFVISFERKTIHAIEPKRGHGQTKGAGIRVEFDNQFPFRLTSHCLPFTVKSSR